MNLIRNLVTLEGIHATKAQEIAALLAARLPKEESVPFLRRRIKDPRHEVAAGAIFAAGQAGQLDLASDIVPLLSDRNLRSAARQALASMGPGIMDDLAAVLSDDNQDFAVRCEIPWILSRIQHPYAAGILVQNLNAEDFRLRYRIVKALNRMHERSPQLPGNAALVAVHLIAQIMAYYEVLALFLAFESKKEPETNDLLARTLRERLDSQLEIVFRLLGLIYPQRDIYFAYTALKGTERSKRISAIEFLDNILKKDVKNLVLPLLEEETPDRLLARGKDLFNVGVSGRNDALISLLRHDPWLKACSLHAVGSDRIPELEPFCRRLLLDPDPRVREMADWALSRMLQRGILYADKS
jgi:HEAT repeat protein